MQWFVFGLCAICVCTVGSSPAKSMKDAIGFPEVEENPSLKNKENRQPVYLPSICPDNELYYPGDQKDDWICDCRPASVYHPASDACWPAWRQGPCLAGFYLTLPNDSVIPVCEKNPCGVSGLVMWQDKCVILGSVWPCSHLHPTAAALNVNATTLEVGCVKLSLEVRFGDSSELLDAKARGTKRNYHKTTVPHN